MTTETTTAPPDTAAIDAIRERANAATPGPWVWRGNMDHEDPRLVGRNRVDEDGKRRFPGMVEVLWSYLRERETDDPGADSYREYLHDTRWEDGLDDDGRMKFRRLTDEEIEEKVKADWVTDAWGEPIRESRMCFTAERVAADDARELAVFEVARAQGLPDDTPRSHERVYRADIVDVRHPDAQFIAHARQDVDTLLAHLDNDVIVKELHRTRCALYKAIGTDAYAEFRDAGPFA